jgi:histidinol-phosphate aminotransferase
MNTVSVSRRRFAQLLGAGAAAALVRPALSLGRKTAVDNPVAASSRPTGIVRLSANENPYGPSPKSHQAMRDSFEMCCRYPDEQNKVLIEKLAKLNGVDREQILLGDGSNEILKLSAEAFTGPNRGNLVAADPTFEALLGYATVGGAEVVKVPLTHDYRHDLSKMATAAKNGLVYVCNPNNPTASVTPKGELRDFIEKGPKGTMILVDEAYFHYANSPDYESVIPLVKDHPNLIVARTFSKIYGMAGLRCGYCVAQKKVVDLLRSYQPWDSINVMALVAASAGLDDANQVPNGRRLNNEAKMFVVGELDKMGCKSIPSQANFIMFDCKKPVVPIIKAMKDRKVQVGRLFPAMPNYMRLTIGKRSEMEAFLAAFRQVMA